jgi:hypothetical protein
MSAVSAAPDPFYDSNQASSSPTNVSDSFYLQNR